MRAIRKGSGQAAHMRRLDWVYAGHPRIVVLDYCFHIIYLLLSMNVPTLHKLLVCKDSFRACICTTLNLLMNSISGHIQLALCAKVFFDFMVNRRRLMLPLV